MFCTVVSVAFTSTSTTAATSTPGESTRSSTGTSSSTGTTVTSTVSSSSTSSKTSIHPVTELEFSTFAIQDILKDTSTVTEFYSGDGSTAVDLVSTPSGLMSFPSEPVVSDKSVVTTTVVWGSTDTTDKSTTMPDVGSGDLDGSGDIDGSGDVDKFFTTLPSKGTTTQSTTTREVVTETANIEATTIDELDLEGDGLFTFRRSTVTPVTRDLTTEILITTKGWGTSNK